MRAIRYAWKAKYGGMEDSKKRLELVAQKAAIEQMQAEYAFSVRRACAVMLLAVSTYRYRSQRRDEPLRSRLVELARENEAASQP